MSFIVTMNWRVEMMSFHFTVCVHSVSLHFWQKKVITRTDSKSFLRYCTSHSLSDHEIYLCYRIIFIWRWSGETPRFWRRMRGGLFPWEREQVHRIYWRENTDDLGTVPCNFLVYFPCFFVVWPRLFCINISIHVFIISLLFLHQWTFSLFSFFLLNSPTFS